MKQVDYIIVDFNHDALVDLMNFTNGFGEEAHYNLIIDSDGGWYDAMVHMSRIVNRYPHTLFISKMHSAAFHFVYRSNGNISLHELSFGSYHLSTMDIPFFEGMKERGISKVYKNQGNTLKGVTNEILSNLSFTDTEKRKILKGEDVYFDKTRLEEIFSYKLLKI